MSQRQDLAHQIDAYAKANTNFYETAELILKLAVNAEKVFLHGDTEVRRNILKLVLWNCTLTSGKPHWEYKKPFAELVEGSKTAIWQP